MHDSEVRVRVKYVPSGEGCEVGGSARGHLFRLRDLALRVIRSRLWAPENGAGRTGAEVASYEIPDGEVLDGPHDLVPYRIGPRIGQKPNNEEDPWA
ncbi:hypothetical protein [Aquimonas sp.]|jgi:hypothetical protein|uniref:hypothetical protein n=1 Tax=Aquimonas sp. TaxID=1872588 RepID=UPI0037BEF7E4